MAGEELTELEKAVVRLVQRDIPMDPRPFRLMAEQLDIEEDELIRLLKDMKERGILRRFGVTLHHQEAGIKANGMGVWVVPEGDAERVGLIMARFSEVSHCYQRPSFEGFPYTHFTMIHAKTEDECEEVARRISDATGIKDYKLLYSTEEFKKTSMRYFEDEDMEQ